eukprot:6182942-Pleurochrysis_carterae.AAC.1
MVVPSTLTPAAFNLSERPIGGVSSRTSSFSSAQVLQQHPMIAALTDCPRDLSSCQEQPQARCEDCRGLQFLLFKPFAPTSRRRRSNSSGRLSGTNALREVGAAAALLSRDGCARAPAVGV